MSKVLQKMLSYAQYRCDSQIATPKDYMILGQVRLLLNIENLLPQDEKALCRFIADNCTEEVSDLFYYTAAGKINAQEP